MVLEWLQKGCEMDLLTDFPILALVIFLQNLF